MKILLAFSLLGLLFVPKGLRTWAWLLPAAFAGLNFFLFLAPESLQPRQNIWVYVAVSQSPWILLGLDLLGRGQAYRILSQTSLRPWILWPLFRFMSVAFFLSMYDGSLPPEFALKTVFGETMVALGALALWANYRPDRGWYRALLFFWNSYGFISAMALNLALLRANPGFPIGSHSLELQGYFAAYPRVWIPLFWVPLSLCIHSAIFFLFWENSRARESETST